MTFLVPPMQKLTFSTAFKTDEGALIPNPVCAYEEYGNPNGPVVCVLHGGMSNSHAAGKFAEDDAMAGWWDGIIGPGCPIDTDRFRVLAPNSLGSYFGSTGAQSINSATGEPWHLDFPYITMVDMARFVRLFLDEMGVKKLHLVAGVSMGSMQALNLAALYPNFVERVAAAATAGRMPPGGMAYHNVVRSMIQSDPDFVARRFGEHEMGLCKKLLLQTGRIYYTHERIIQKSCWDTIQESPNAHALRIKASEVYLSAGLERDLKALHPLALLTLLNATNAHDLGSGQSSYTTGVERIRANTLLMNFTTDQQFPPVWAQEVADILNARSPKQAECHAIDSDWGHLGCVKEIKAIGDLLRSFLSST